MEIERSVIKTKDLFTFELDMGSGSQCLNGRQLEDILYNCLDFSILYHCQPHFFLRGADTLRHPELWSALEILHEEGATFSLLRDPELREFESREQTRSEENTVEIKSSGDVQYLERCLGNMLNDRLADMLIFNNHETMRKKADP